VYLAAALDAAGWHPAAWRDPGARPRELFTPSYWCDLALEAEAGLLDFVTIEDSLGLQSSGFAAPEGRRDQVRGRLDAMLIAARVAPVTRWLGLVPTAVVTHTEPFHLSKAVATLDYVSLGRAGWRAQISPQRTVAGHFGRRQLPELGHLGFDDPRNSQAVAELLDEASDYVEVVRRLWDSWEDDAVIRDVETGRFVDRDKLHYIDFRGRFFDVRGPSITPRPPQGQPVVAALAHTDEVYRFGAQAADVVFVTPGDAGEATGIAGRVRELARDLGRSGQVRVLADVYVVIEERAAAAHQRASRLDELDGGAYRSDALIFSGSPIELADLLVSWHEAGVDGFRLRPAVLPVDLLGISRGLVPELQRRGAFRRGYESDTLRGHLGMGRPANRYEVA